MTRRPVPLALLFLAGSGLAGTAAPPPSIGISTGMIWDPARPAILMTAEPKVRTRGRVRIDELGLESVDPVTGRIRWRTKAASVPLVTWRGQVLALVETHGVPGLPLVLLDGGTGKLVRTLPLLREAGGIGARIGEAMSSSFEITASRSGDVAFLTWKTASWYVGGVPAPRNYRAAGGTVAVDLVSGGSLGVTSREVAPEGSGNPYLIPAPGPHPYHIAPYEIDGVRCELALTGTSNGADALLRRTRGGDRLPDTVLGPVKALYINVWKSVDGRHLLRTEQVEPQPTPAIYRWAVFESATGHRVAAFDVGGMLPRYLVHGRRIIAFLEGAVVAYDLATGAPGWSRGGRNLRYHGSYPP